MKFLKDPFSILVIGVVLTTIVLFSIASSYIEIRLYKSTIPGSIKSPLEFGRVYHTPPRSTYLTGTDGLTDGFSVGSDDVLAISKVNYKPLTLQLIHLASNISQLGVTLFQYGSREPKLEGRVSTSGGPLSNITVTCEGCIETSTTSTTGEDGRYSIPTGRLSREYILHFQRMGTEVATIKVETETNDDHARIDVVFDDSSPIVRFFFPPHSLETELPIDKIDI